MALVFSNSNKFLLNNQQILRSGRLQKQFLRFPESVFLVLISVVRYKQRGHIPNQLVEHHRQSPLGKAKAGAAVGVSPPKDEKDPNLRTTPHDFKYERNILS